MRKLFLPLCIFAATLAHAAASMTVSVEPKGVTKPQLTAATNSVFALVTAALGDLAGYCNSTAQSYANSAQNAAITESKVWGRSATNTVTRGYYDLSQQLYTLTQTERRNSTNALFQTVKSAIDSAKVSAVSTSTNLVTSSLKYPFLGVSLYAMDNSSGGYTTRKPFGDNISYALPGSSPTSASFALVGSNFRSFVEVFSLTSGVTFTLDTPSYYGSVHEFSIKPSGLSSKKSVSFMLRITFTPLEFDIGLNKRHFYDSGVFCYYFTCTFWPSTN